MLYMLLTHSSLNTQPLEIRSGWNWGLHVTSSCHRVKVYSVNKSHALTAQRLKMFEEHGESLAPITRPTEFPTMVSPLITCFLGVWDGEADAVGVD